jgi:hypothetical protein
VDILSITSIMPLQTKSEIHGQNERIAPENNERRKRKREIRDQEEAALIYTAEVLYVPGPIG